LTTFKTLTTLGFSAMGRGKNGERKGKGKGCSEIKELQKVISEQSRRIEELEGSQEIFQKEKMDFEKRQIHLEKKAEAAEKRAEGLQKRIWVLDSKRRCKVLGEKEIRPLIEKLDGSAKTAQAANVELQQQLQKALEKNSELEVKVQELEQRLSEAAAKQQEAILVALQDAELLRAYKRSKEYIRSDGASIAEWRALDWKGVDKVQRFRRRASDPPRPEEEVHDEEMCAIHEWLQEGLPPMSPLKKIRLRIEFSEGLVEVLDLMGRCHLDYGILRQLRAFARRHPEADEAP